MHTCGEERDMAEPLSDATGAHGVGLSPVCVAVGLMVSSFAGR